VKSKRNLKLTKEIKKKIVKSKVRRLNQIQDKIKGQYGFFYWTTCFSRQIEREKERKRHRNQTSYRINTRTTLFERERHDLSNAIINGQFLPPKSSARAS